jgi:hypothetical protein
MNSNITVSTYRYTQAYGNQPGGFRLWYFLMPGGRTFRHSGDYEDAVRAATAHAQKLSLSPDTILQVFA